MFWEAAQSGCFNVDSGPNLRNKALFSEFPGLVLKMPYIRGTLVLVSWISSNFLKVLLKFLLHKRRLNMRLVTSCNLGSQRDFTMRWPTQGFIGFLKQESSASHPPSLPFFLGVISFHSKKNPCPWFKIFKSKEALFGGFQVRYLQSELVFSILNHSCSSCMPNWFLRSRLSTLKY